MENNEYSNEMRGTLWILDDAQRKDKEKSPIATGTITISGVQLRISMWPHKKVNKPGSKADGKTYMPLAIEYQKGATKFLAGIRPADVTVTAAVAEPQAEQTVSADDVDDLPF